MFDVIDYTQDFERDQSSVFPSSGASLCLGLDESRDVCSPLAIVHNGRNTFSYDGPIKSEVRSISFFPGMIERDRSLLPEQKSRKKEESESSKRGEVIGFSRKSRSRLMRKLREYEFRPGHVFFSTLTYPFEYPTDAASKAHLRAFIKRLRYRYGADRVGVHWRIESQERGSPHFHLMIFLASLVDEAVLSDWIYQTWVDIVGSSDWRHLFCGYAAQTEVMGSERGVVAYLSKYIAKEDKENCYRPIPGRQWGKEGKFPLKTVCFEGQTKDIDAFWRLLQKSKGLSGHVFGKKRRGSERKKYRAKKRTLKRLGLWEKRINSGNQWKAVFCSGLHEDWLRLASMFSIQVDCRFEPFYLSPSDSVPW